MRALGLILAGLALSAVAGCFGPSATARYRLTLEVAVGDRVVSGSSVHEKTYGRNWLPSAMPFYTRFKGEAVAVDLGERGLLFALLTGRHETGSPIRSGFETMPRDVFARTGAIRVNADQVDQWQTLAKGSYKAELRRDEIPFLVHFRDVADPMSIERVDPGGGWSAASGRASGSSVPPSRPPAIPLLPGSGPGCPGLTGPMWVIL